MKTTVVAATCAFAVILSVAALSIGAAVETPPTLMSPADFAHARKSLEADSRLALTRCRAMPPGQRELCRAEARAAERVARADLQARYYGTISALNEARLARAKASFDVAKARCAAAGGAERADCLRAARGDRNRQLAEERLAFN